MNILKKIATTFTLMVAVVYLHAQQVKLQTEKQSNKAIKETKAPVANSKQKVETTTAKTKADVKQTTNAAKADTKQAATTAGNKVAKTMASVPNKTIQTGARGGKYYINKNGNKTYVK